MSAVALKRPDPAPTADISEELANLRVKYANASSPEMADDLWVVIERLEALLGRGGDHK